MAATETATGPRRPPEDRRAEDARARPRQPLALALALGIALVYAGFASGATGLPEEGYVQVWLAAVSIAAVAGLTFGRSLRALAGAPAGLGLALLAGFAAWCALSLAWSIAPDETWLEANRALAYLMAAGLGVVLGSSAPRAAEWAALGFVAIAAAVALYALAGKLVPWLEVPGVLDLGDDGRIARLREPLGYWNALALLCALAVPAALRAAADLGRSARLRVASVAAAVVLLCATVLALSRGAIVVLVAALVVQLVLSGDRRRLLGVAGAALVGAAPAVTLALLLPDLTEDGLSESARTGEGLLALIALIAGCAVAALAARAVLRSSAPAELGPRGRRAARRGALAALGLALVVLVGGAALSEGGLARTEPARPETVTDQRVNRETNPSRLLRTGAGHRWDWWQEAVGAAWDRPLTGHGAGSFPLLHRAYRQSPLDVRQAHSVPLEFLAETGLVGALLAVGGLGLLGLAAARGALDRPDERQRGYAVALLAAASAWGLHLFVDWDWEIPAVTLPPLIALGLLAARPSAPTLSRPSMAPGPVARAVSLGLGTLALCLAAASALLPSLAREWTNDAFGASLTGGRAELEEAARDAETASRLDPLSTQPLLAGVRVAERQGRYRRTADLVGEALERQPDDPAVWAQVARLQLLAGDIRASSASSLVGLSLDPFNRPLLFFLLLGGADERASATATGTPLPRTAPVPGPAPPTPPAGAPAQPGVPPATPGGTTPTPPPQGQQP